ncbi:MAG: phosphatase PAP2 family protein [Clostridia bacterium]|nr:phosphatase PAP2 family protein [Clostridia bacterium]
MAEWLNNTFYGFDDGVFNALHNFAIDAGGFFTPFFKAVSVIGEKGIVFFVLAIIFMLFSKTRKQGVCMFGALCIGAIIASLILKNTVARVRPYDASAEYAAFWEYVKGSKSDSFCFPSGHTTMITAAMTAMFICFNKKWSWLGFLGVLLMGISRIYLIAHYATDVLGGIIVGVISAVIAYFITKLIFFLLEKYKDKKFCAWCLNFDIRLCFKKKSDGENESQEK